MKIDKYSQNLLASTGEYDHSKEYWLNQLKSESIMSGFPVDFQVPKNPGKMSGKISFQMPEGIYQKLAAMSNHSDHGMYMILLSSVMYLLYRYTGNEDVIIGMPLLKQAGDSDVANTLLPVAMVVNKSNTYKEMLLDMKRIISAANQHQIFPLDIIAELMGIQTAQGEFPDLNTIVLLKNIHEESCLESLNTQTVISFTHTGEGLEMCIEYCQNQYKTATVQQLIKLLVHFLEVVTQNPAVPLNDIGIPEEDKIKILSGFNRTAMEYPKDKTIHELFEEQVKRTPDKVAVRFKASGITYWDLNKKANQLAGLLVERGVKPGVVVGIMVNRSIEMMIGILGTLKAGGAYLPIDPAYPSERIKYMLEDGKVKVLLSRLDIADKVGYAGITIDPFDRNIYKDEPLNLTGISKPNDIAYVIYTSGSTGKPKGVMIEHKPVVNFITGMTDQIAFSSSKTILALTTVSFDIFALETLLPLSTGMEIVIADENQQNNARLLSQLITESGIDILQATPSRMQLLLSDTESARCVKHLKEILIGGEAFPKTLLETLTKLTNAKIYNMYGPTETTVWSAIKELTGSESINIGRPIANTRIYILDDNRNLQPVGVKGELYIAGDGLARGYFGRDDLTQERFVTDPFVPGEKMYRTGDIAQWTQDGEIEYCGRSDHQVKIRGYRIELAEIEGHILKQDGIKEAAVVDIEDADGNKSLCAYLVSDKPVAAAEIRKCLEKELPAYAIPSYVVRIDKLPFTPNGKLDRKALPKPENIGDRDVAYVAPRNATEEKLAGIWQEILGVQNIGVKDDFFELGGHSLKAAALVSKIYKEFNAEIAMGDIFKATTIEKLSEIIASAEKSTYLSIQPVGEMDRYLVSSAQKRLFVLNRIGDAGINYNIPLVMKLKGSLNEQCLEEAFKKLIKRHEILRTSFEFSEGEAYQIVHGDVEFQLECSKAQETGVKGMIKSFIKPFNLQNAPLIRAGVVGLNENEYILMVDMHHIVSDGISMAIIVKELFELYEGTELPPLRIQYKDFSAWQNNLSDSDSMKKQEAYWLNVFQDEVPVITLPTDYPRPVMQSFEGDRLRFKADRELTAKLKNFASDTGATLHMVFLAAFNSMLYLCSGQEDIVVGTIAAGRSHSDLDKIVGVFVNTLALRNYPNREKTFKAFLAEVKENTIKAYENQDYQFETLVEKLDIKRDLSRNPLFDCMLVMQNMDIPNGETAHLKYAPYDFEYPVSKFDLTLHAMERNHEIEFSLEYCTAIFKKETIERFSGYFLKVLKEVLLSPSIKLSDIDMLSEREKELLLYDFNTSQADFPREATLYKLFEDQVKRTPERIALKFENCEMTYLDLNTRANQIAKRLREQGVKQNSIVAIMASRSMEMIIGILGILKSGGAYLPIDPEYPNERIRFMLEDSGACIVLTQGSTDLGQFFVENEKPYKVLSLNDGELYLGEGTNLENINQPGDLAYIIYTSGTTGKSKGAMIEHRNVVRLLFNDKFQFDFKEKDVWTLFHSFCFDFSVWEMYGALLYGGTLVIVPKEVAKDPKQYLNLLKTERVTVLNQTPTAFYNLIDEELAASGKNLRIRYVIFGGEALKPIMLKGWSEKYPETKLINMYGITETTVHVTYKEISENEIDSNISNIGKPIPTLTTYIMDKNSKLMPFGAAGELCVGGDGVGRGYLNRPDLTAEKFIENPYIKGERLYRSGDLAKFLQDGEMEYLGRIDYQVKIRGHRIELGEIESELLKYSSVKEVIALAREDASGNKYICVYFVSENEISTSELRNYLATRLPNYMMPAFFIQIEKIPLTSNNKVDRKALPVPDGNNLTGEEYEAPRNEKEEILAGIWQDILMLQKVSIAESFFNLGGDSIKAISLISRINKAFGSNLQIRDLYINQSVKALSDILHISEGNNVEEELSKGLEIIDEFKNKILDDKGDLEHLPESFEDFYPLSPIQQGMVFFAKLWPDQPIYHDQFPYMIKLKEFDITTFNRAIKVLAQKHPILRTTFELENFSEPVQVVHKTDSGIVPIIEFEDLASLSKENQEAEIMRYMKNDLADKFLVDKELLWRMRVFKFNDMNYCLILSFQHAVLDGWSVAALFTELVEIYRCLQDTGNYQAQALKSTYKDYVAICRMRQVSEKVREFWKQELQGYSHMKMPFNISNKKINQVNGNKIYKCSLGNELLNGLEQKTKEYGCTLQEICLSAYVYLLSVITGENDIVTGIVSHDRPALEDGEKVLGCFLNTIPVRVKIENQVMKSELVKEVKSALTRVKSNELFLVDIASTIGENSFNGNPIFDTLLNYTDFHVLKDIGTSEAIDAADCTLELESSEMTNTLFDLEISRSLNIFSMQIKYSPNYFYDEDIRIAADLYIRILEQFAFCSQQTLSRRELLTSEQKQKLVYDFNDTVVAYSKDKTMHQLFEEQVLRTPDHIALVHEDKMITYKELNEKANQLSWFLLEKGVKPGSQVGLITQRGFEMIIGMFAILKSGCAYVPMDPEYPDSRKETIANNARLAAVLTDKEYPLNLENTIVINQTVMNSYSTENPGIEKDSKDLAYIIYTSGSTGVPKGVMIEHHSAVNLISWVNQEFHVNEDDALLFITSMCFDLSVYDIFGILSSGGKVVIAKKEQVQNPEELRTLMEKEKITFWDSVPSTMNYLVNALEESCEAYIQDSLRLVFMSGDWIPVKLPEKIKKFFPNAEVISLGGATEGTVWSIYYPIRCVSEYQTSIPYGKPIDNNYFYILDKDLNLIPPGVAGELYIGGVGVARGYMNDEVKTNASFITNRFLDSENEMMYKTGDLGRMLPDGNIEFLGRQDHQVKIRGYRVELGEIESKLTKHPAVKEAVAIDKTDSSGNKYICAYIVWNKEITVSEIKTYLSNELPEYMVPSQFVGIEEVPLTSNGKIDRKSLPEPDGVINTGVLYEAPRNEIEEDVVKIWQEVLEVNKVGINDNFFDLGGHSLKATGLVSKIHKHFNVEISLREAFSFQTVSEMAELIRAKSEQIDQVEQMLLDIEKMSDEEVQFLLAQEEQRMQRK